MRKFGLEGSPIRYTLHVNLVKLKLLRPMDGKRITLKIKAMDEEQKVDVLSENMIGSDDQIISNEQDSIKYYSIKKDLQFNLSYGVTKVSIRGF